MDSLEGEVTDIVDHLESGVVMSSFTMLAPCFENLFTLKVLDLSRTNIQSLPPSITKLSLLVNLTLQECSMLMVIPPEIGILKNLATFDLEGTEIMYLPVEMGKLENLQCLRVSFCAYADEYKDCNGIENIIPRTIMSKLSKLEELSICVNPDAKWWEIEVIEAVLEKLHFLPCLRILKLYLPTVKELQYFFRLENCNVPIYSTLRDFRLKVGHCEQLPSYLKTNLVDSFEKLEKCLKYENGEGNIDGVKELVRHANALFVCRHWTIKKLSIFDISRLKYCLLAECNNMRNIVDADELNGDIITTHDNDGNDPFEVLEYLAIHSMNNLESIWKGPIARNSFNRLQVLALHTCPELTTVFTDSMLHNLQNLTVLIVEDCPKIESLISLESYKSLRSTSIVLPNLERLLLLDLPELVSLSNGVNIAPRLDTLLVFNCLKLNLFPSELSIDVKEINGETEWWNALKNKYKYSGAFVPLKRDGDFMNQLAEDTNSLREYHKLQSSLREFHKLQSSLREYHKLQSRGKASTMSGSTFVPPDSRPLRAQFSFYETTWHLCLDMFMQYLNYKNPPLPFVEINSGHVIKFLKYLNKFGGIRVHVQSCVLFGHPDQTVSCFCPLMEAWGTLEAIATRLIAAYEEYRFPGMLPLAISDIQSYLNEVRKTQENGCGIPSKNHDLPVLTVKKTSPKKGTINNERKGFGSPGALTESDNLIEALQDDEGRGNKSEGTIAEASTELHNPILDVSVSDHVRFEEIYDKFSLDDFRRILQVGIKSRQHSLMVNSGSTTFIGTSTQDSCSINAVHEDEYVKSNTMSPEAIRQLRYYVLKASLKGNIQPFVEIYIAERKTMMQSRFIQFNIEKWSTNGVKRFEWGVLESLIEVWINSVKISLECLYASEKKLCERIFLGLGTDIEDISLECLYASEKKLCERIFLGLGTDIEDICSEVIIQDYQIKVFNIIYTLSFTNPPPDKLFLILDLYQTLDHFLNDMCSLAKTRDLSKAAVHTQLLCVLADKIISSLSLFEMVLLYHESSVIFVGPVDPLPRYVMSYLCQLCDHKHTLRKLSLPKLPSIDEDDLILYSEELKGQSELSRHVIWIIMMIVSNMEGKAKLCEDGSAGHFFAMKNISYIVQKIEGHQELKEVIGYDYYGKLIQKLDHAKVNYLRLEIEKIIHMRVYGAE